MQTRSNRRDPRSRLSRKLGARHALVALLAVCFLCACWGCNEDTIRRDVGQGAYQLFQNGLSSAVTGLSSQMTGSIAGASGSGGGP
jgi:hypothetical protein